MVAALPDMEQTVPLAQEPIATLEPLNKTALAAATVTFKEV